jgi:tripartite-type tricarboxylate transporter receptor subunit TctC
MSGVQRALSGLGRLASVALAAGIMATSVPVDAAAEWPDRPITIIVHFAPGGSNDLLGRLIANELAPVLNQGVVVQNRPGANGDIGVAAAARSAPDGYTLLVASGSALVNPSIANVSYDLLKDFAPVAYLGASPNVILAGPSSGMSKLSDLVAKAKAKPGTLNYATPGVGSTPHLAMELLKLRMGLDIAHIPFNGLGPAVTAVLGGVTELSSTTVAGVLSNVTSGQLKALVQTGKQRWPELPDVPTIEEAGVENAASETCQIVLAPTGTPKPILDRLTMEIEKIMARPLIHERMLAAGFAVRFEGQEKARELMTAEIKMWKEVAQTAHIRRN